ncbi:MAG TPA: N-acetylmuramoyl-L-alanine amidase [Niabella sp.]|nr:N-acetylmuramoyl-L-alanine amidase [Niabella sp.]
MRISQHKLVAENGEAAVSFVNSPNQSGVITPAYLIIHYTAGGSAQSSINWFQNPGANASAHLVIGLDGKITQMVPFNKKAYHAGVSSWAGLSGLNSYSIGIELDNPGKLKRVGNKWVSWFGVEYPESKVIVAKHKNQDTESGWHIFTPVQIEACIKVSLAIYSHYKLKDILGHDDIAPGRKEDPGPAFPMGSFKSRVMGRHDDHAAMFKTTGEGVRFRTGPGLNYDVAGKLKKGVKVEFIDNVMDWFHVKLAQPVAGISEPEGWVHSSLLGRV